MTGWLLLLMLMGETEGPLGASGESAPEGVPGPTPAVQLAPWTTGPNTITPTAGEGGLAILIPIAEPLSVGAPPLAPVLVRRLAVGYPVRRVQVRSGEIAALALDTKPRPRFSVLWDGLEKSDRDLLLAWIKGDLEGTRFAFDLAVDGTEEVVTVRPVADALDEWRNKAAYAVSMDVEEVF